MAFANYYSSYVPNYADLAAGLMDKLKVGRHEGKKGNKVAVQFTDEDRKSFQAIKDSLLSGLELQTVNPDKPFVLRVDASERAVGTALEQFADDFQGRPPLNKLHPGKQFRSHFVHAN